MTPHPRCHERIHMIFAELDYPDHYEHMHQELVTYISAHFPHIQSGLQSDSWIWITRDGSRVAIDTFSSMKHQVKADKAGTLVEEVIEVLQRKYRLRVYETPEIEGHEDA